MTARPVGSRDLDVLVVGDVNPDVVVSDPDPRPVFGQAERVVEAIGLTIGGSATIAACAAARLGLRVALAGAVGDDAMGRLVLEMVAARGVDVSACRVVEGVATGATVVLAGGGDRAILTATGAIAELRATDVPSALLAQARHVHVGSFFLQPALAAGVPSLFRAARAGGATTSLDPNFDPSETWNGGIAAALAETDIVLPNAVEAIALAGADAVDLHGIPNAVEAAVAISGRGARRVVAAKLGEDGAVGVDVDGQVIAVMAPRVEPADTIGAGDAFDAGFIAGWLEGHDIVASLQLAVACGALSTRGRGGVDGQPSREEAERLAPSLMPAARGIAASR